MNPLLGLVQLFRTNKYALLADIKKAFLNIFISDVEDQNRFSFVLYVNNKFHYFRYKTILFGFAASPFILNFCLKHLTDNVQNPEINRIISNNFYVDNMIVTSNDPEKLKVIYNDVTNELNQGGFYLQEWITNSSLLAKETEAELVETKVLGYSYCPNNDCLSFKQASLNPSASTKREVLSSVASVFDPLGMLGPVMLKPKLFIRKLHDLKFDWDEKLQKPLLNEWNGLATSFNELRNLSFTREAYNGEEPLELFIFCDASKEAYGCAIFAIQNDASNLIFSKTKLAPKFQRTLPSLELLAVYLGLQNVITLVSDQNFKATVNKITFVTDSLVALSWLINGRAQKKNVFVNNRLSDISKFKDQISSVTSNIFFRYVPSSHNVADVLTRGTCASRFAREWDTWIKGPNWMLSEVDWPSGNLGCLPSKPASCRGEDWPKVTDQGLVLSQICFGQDSIVDFRRFSSYTKLFNSTLCFFKAVNLFKKQTVSDCELKSKVFKFLIKEMQNECFPDEKNFFQNSCSGKVTKLIRKFNLFVDSSGIIRAKCRLENSSSVSYENNNPILLGNHHFSTLLIKKFHFKIMHLGLESTLTKLRSSGYLLLNARNSVSRFLKSCIVCNKYNCRSGASNFAPSLPSCRTNYIKPFSSVGIDYTGHFFVREDEEKKKVYILLFTCLMTRAVHLELLRDLETQSFIFSFLRFINRYGLPREVYSDNAKTFLSGSAILSNIILSSPFLKTFSTENIKFKNIPIYSPWFGGCWERLMRTVKSCIYKTIQRNIISFECFNTLLSDIQQAVNSRPLFYKSDKDLNVEVITPNLFLQPHESLDSSVLIDEKSMEDFELEEVKNDLISSLEVRDIFVNKFNKLWFNKYLFSLKHPFQNKKTDFSSKFMPGKIVLLKVPNRPRPYWNLGRITDVLSSNDETRVFKVKRADGREVITSIDNTFPLELDLDEGEIEDRSLDLNSSFLSPPYSSNLKDNKIDALNPSFELSKAKSLSSVSLDESDACSSDSSNLNISRAD